MAVTEVQPSHAPVESLGRQVKREHSDKMALLMVAAMSLVAAASGRWGGKRGMVPQLEGLRLLAPNFSKIVDFFRYESAWSRVNSEPVLHDIDEQTIATLFMTLHPMTDFRPSFGQCL
jgi:hypothetical protein